MMYLTTRPLAMDLCYLVDLKGKITAGEAARQLGLAIQTTTGTLRDMETYGILTSRKVGRVRTYTAKDEPVLSLALLQTTPLKRSRFKGVIRPMQTLLGRLEEGLGKSGRGYSLLRDVNFETPLVALTIDFQLTPEKGLPYAILISRVENVFYTLGKLLLLSTRKDAFRAIILVNLFTEGSKGVKAWAFSEVVSPFFKDKLIVIEEHADDLNLITPDYADNLTQKIWTALSSRTRS